MSALGKKFQYMLAAEGKTITNLEKQYMKKERNQVYIALEDIDFIWSEKEVKKFRLMWDSDFSIKEIASKLKRPIDDVAMLIYDQALKSKIEPRNGGLMGEESL